MNAIEKRICALGDDDREIRIVKEINVGEATMYIFDFGDTDCSAAIIYNHGGKLFHLRDWQSGYPKNKEDIEKYDWLTENGRMGIVFNGLPRILE